MAKNAFDDSFEPKNAFDESFAPPGTTEGLPMRLWRDTAAVGSGILRAGQHAAGVFGDIHQMFGVPNSPFSTSEDIGKHVGGLAQRVGLSPDLAKPETPEGKFIEPMVQGATAMTSASPWLLGAGGAMGLSGELASRLMDVQGGPEDQGPSGWRTAGEAAVLAPTLAMSLMKPREVARLGPILDRMGATKADVVAAIDKAKGKADLAAQALNLPYTGVSSQIPQMSGVIKELRGSAFGKPLDTQATNELEAIKQWGQNPTWPMQGSLNPSTAALLQPINRVDPTPSLANIVRSAAKTENFPEANLISGAGHSPVGKFLAENWNPIKWPGLAWQGIQRVAGNQAIKELVKGLTGPRSAEKLKGIATFSTPEHIAKELVRALMAAQEGSGPASTESVTLPDLPKIPGIKLEITGSQ